MGFHLNYSTRSLQIDPSFTATKEEYILVERKERKIAYETREYIEEGKVPQP